MAAEEVAALASDKEVGGARIPTPPLVAPSSEKQKVTPQTSGSQEATGIESTEAATQGQSETMSASHKPSQHKEVERKTTMDAEDVAAAVFCDGWLRRQDASMKLSYAGFL